ncbi:putative reverse transcriptase domain-containing protein [Tanacetum coccineum]
MLRTNKDYRGQQPPFKRQNVARAYTAGNNERKPYNRLLPLYNKCKLHHKGPCTVRCGKCNKVGHLTWDCKVTRHFRSDCPKLKDQNHGNKVGNKNGVGEARGEAYVLGGGDANPDSNVVKGTFLLNNHYASMIFDSGADRSFVSTTFSTLLDITPDTLDVSYAVELADGRISKTNTILRGCTLGLLGNPFNIDLMPVELGSFDIIISMDWLENHHAVIVYDRKIVRIPFGDEVLIVQGDRDGKGEKSKLSIISCTKTQKYIKRGCPIFLAQVTEKEIENESEEKRLEDVPTVRDFPEVFPKDLPGLPPTRQPMTKLTQKNVKFDWSEKAEAAFQLLKQQLCSASILALPEGTVKQLRVRALDLTIDLTSLCRSYKKEAQFKAKEEIGTEDLCGMIKKLEQRANGTLCLNGRSWIPCFVALEN